MEQGRQAITACAFIYKDGKLFAPQRASTKKFLPNKFELPGGHIEYGEDIIAGLKREIKEEFCIKLKIEDPIYAFTYINDVKNTHSIEVVYLAQMNPKTQNITLNTEDHQGYKWVTEEEAKILWGVNDSEYKAVIKGFSILKETKYR